MHQLIRLTIPLIFLAARLSISVPGQSGRRQKRAESQPPVQGVNQPEARTPPEPTITPEEERPKEQGPGIIVMTGMPDAMVPIFFADIARQGCINEFRTILRGAHDIREARNQNRTDAIKVAREEDKYYVLWLEIEFDRLGTSMMGVDLRYTIYEPQTAKVAGVGNGFPVQPTSGSPVPPLGASRQQMLIDWAARDVARQVVKRLGWRL
ncbi:MAG: hypothetical protein ACK5RS_16680 [Acidobacteriota bacterium]